MNDLACQYGDLAFQGLIAVSISFCALAVALAAVPVVLLLPP